MSPVISIDLGGTAIKYGILDPGGNLLWNRQAPTPTSSKKEVIEALTTCIREALEREPDAAAVGIGTPGLVDSETGLVKGGAFQLPEWENLPLGDILKERTGLPVFVDNDANLMGLGEFRFGMKEHLRNAVFITVGTGIGGAIIINGELYRGHFFAGTELGCFPFSSEGRQGYWEDFASAAALVDRYKQLSGKTEDESVNGKYLFKQAALGDLLAVDCIGYHTQVLGQGIGGYINVFNPEMVIIGGGLSESGPAYIEAVRTESLKWALPDCSRSVRIEAAVLGNRAGLLGAGYFAQTQMER